MKRKPTHERVTAKESRRPLWRNFSAWRLAPACLVDRLQLLAGLEAHGFARRNGNFCAGARVAANSGFARAYIEDAEAPQFDAISGRKRLLHAFKNGFDRKFGLRLRDAGAVHNFVDDVEFNHGLPSSPEE